jgi:hypothetical protein
LKPLTVERQKIYKISDLGRHFKKFKTAVILKIDNQPKKRQAREGKLSKSTKSQIYRKRQEKLCDRVKKVSRTRHTRLARYIYINIYFLYSFFAFTAFYKIFLLL